MNASISRFTPVLLGCLAVLLAACSATGTASGTDTAAPRGSGASGGSAPGASRGQASPGQASTGQASTGPASTGPASTGPASPAADGAPLCAMSQLALRIGGGLVSGGEDIYYIYFKNTGATVCSLRGYPGVSAVTGPSDSASQIGADAKRSATSPTVTQVLKPGQSVQATLQFARAGNYVSPQCQHVNVLYLKIFPPGGTTAAYAGSDEQVCAETTLPTMTITAVTPDR